MNFGKWLSNAVKSAGHEAGVLANVVEKGTGQIVQDIKNNPQIVGLIATAAAAAGGGDVDVSQITGIIGKVTSGLSHPAEAIQQLAGQAGSVLQNNPVMQAARSMVPQAGLQGFDAAATMMKIPNLDPNAANMIRSALPASAQQAFDTAVAAHHGQAISKVPDGNPVGQAAFAITKGLQGAPPAQSAAIVSTVIAADAAAKNGTVLAIKEVAVDRQVAALHEGVWTKFMKWLGLE
jgi:hypothetical protein